MILKILRRLLRRKDRKLRKLAKLAKKAGVPIEAVELYMENYGIQETIKALKALAKI